MKLLMCNLKANKTLVEFNEYLEKIKDLESKESLVIFPSHPYLSLMQHSNVAFGSQDVSLHDSGSYTGEVTANQVKSLGAIYAIIGHSERRKSFGEDEYLLAIKVKRAMDANLKVVYCIGETKEEKLRHKTYQVLEKQIAKIFNNLSENAMNDIIIAYEPVWAIGTGNPAKEKDIEEIVSFIKKIILDYYDVTIKVLYGGSINKDNITSLSKINNIDGFLVGKASLNPEEVSEMLKICAK